MAVRQPLEGTAQLRWERADEPAAQGQLFEPVRREVGRGEFRGMEFLHVHARRILNEVKGGGDSAALPFRWTINAYRGCSHACTYCFARPTHEYLGLGIGADFDQRIVVKVNAVERLRAELNPARWGGELIAMGTNTDPYQRCEGKYRLTRGLVRTLTEAGNPFSILTKSTLVLRDLDLLVAAARATQVRVNLSIGTLDEDVWRATEPGTPHPRRRMRAVEQLNAAGVPCGVLVAPVLPGLSDGPEQLEAVARACVEAGAVSVSTLLLHLRPGVRGHFLARLGETHPELVPRYERLYRGSYAPTDVRRRASSIVHATIRQAGGRSAARRDPEHLVGQPSAPQGEAPAAVAAPGPAPAEQLDLGL
ncbi:MAG: Radical protein [Acidimicrobiales bacterium]|nr:Radical protein [Acidimicrobiales bacterium]